MIIQYLICILWLVRVVSWSGLALNVTVFISAASQCHSIWTSQEFQPGNVHVWEAGEDGTAIRKTQLPGLFFCTNQWKQRSHDSSGRDWVSVFLDLFFSIVWGRKLRVFSPHTSILNLKTILLCWSTKTSRYLLYC